MFMRLTMFAVLISALSFNFVAQADDGAGGGGGDAIGSLPKNFMLADLGGGGGGDSIGSLPLNQLASGSQSSVSVIYKVVVPCVGNCNVATMTGADWAQLRDTFATAVSSQLNGAAFERAFAAALNNGNVTIRNAGQQAEATALLDSAGDETVGSLPLQSGGGTGGDTVGSLPLAAKVGAGDETVGTLP